MSGAIYQAAAGALLQQIRLDVLSNNLANVNTVGFKAEKPIFRMAQPIENGYPTASAGGLSPLAPPMEQIVDFSSGPLQQTGNSLDVAIVGKGFFEVMTPSGPQYTRSGSFTVNTDGYLSTADGSPVMGQGSNIRIEGSAIDISDSGDVLVDGDVVDRLKVVDFPEPYDLQKVGEARFIPKGFNQYPSEAGNFTIAQGYVETSNVDAIRTMTELIETMRAFESYQRVIRSADDALSKTVNEVGRTA